MNIIRDFAECPPDYKGAVVALGNFDGVHLGHQAILQACLTTARQLSAPSAVMTFEPHPREFFAPGKERLRIETFRRKVELMRALGIDAMFVVRFNKRFSSLSAKSFVGDVLARQLAVRHVVTGYNFAFGKGRGGNTDFLQAQAVASGFGFSACPAVQDGTGGVVSSSMIRQLLAAGNVRKAAALLGRPYEIEGHVRHGEKRGRKLGFPTANLSLAHLFKPRFGVYAVRLAVPGDARRYDAVANLGLRPTFGAHEPLLEVHGFDMQQELYGKRVRVEFSDFIRDEKRFDSVEGLRMQIEADCAQAKQVLAGV